MESLEAACFYIVDAYSPLPGIATPQRHAGSIEMGSGHLGGMPALLGRKGLTNAQYARPGLGGIVRHRNVASPPCGMLRERVATSAPQVVQATKRLLQHRRIKTTDVLVN